MAQNPLDVDFTQTLTSLATAQKKQAGEVVADNEQFVNDLTNLSLDIKKANQRRTAYNTAAATHITGLKQQYQNADMAVADASATPFHDLIALFSDDTESIDKLILRKKNVAMQIRQAQDTAGFMSKTFDADVSKLQSEIESLAQIQSAKRQGRADVVNTIGAADASLVARDRERTNYFTANVSDAELLDLIQSGNEQLAPVPWMMRLYEGRQLENLDRKNKRRGPKVTEQEFLNSISGDQMRELVAKSDSVEGSSPLWKIKTPLGERELNESTIRKEWQRRQDIEVNYIQAAVDVAQKTVNLSAINDITTNAAVRLYGNENNMPGQVQLHLSALDAASSLRQDTPLGVKHSATFAAVVQAANTEAANARKVMQESIAKQWTDKDAQKAVETYVFDNTLPASRGTFKAIDEYMRTINTGDLITTTGAFAPMFTELQKAYESEFQAIKQDLFAGSGDEVELSADALNQMLFAQNRGKESGITIWNRIRRKADWDKSAQDKLLLFSMPMAVQMLKQQWGSDLKVMQAIDDVMLDGNGQFKREYIESQSTIQDIMHALTRVTVQLRGGDLPILAPTENLAQSFGAIISDQRFLTNNVQRHYDNMDVGAKMTIQNVLGRDWMPMFIGALHSSVSGYQYDYNIRQQELRVREEKEKARQESFIRGSSKRLE